MAAATRKVRRTFLGSSSGGGGGGPAPVNSDAERLNLRWLSMQPEVAAQTLTLNSGVAVYMLGYTPSACTITKLWMWIRVAAATSTGSNTMAIFDAAGTKLGETGDMTTGFSTAASFISGTLSGSVSLTAGQRFYVGALTHFSSGPTVIGALSGSGAGVDHPNGGFNGIRPSIYQSGQTAFPGAFAPVSLSVNSGGYVMGAS